MAARALLYHPLHARPPSSSSTWNSRYPLPRRFFSSFEGFPPISSCRMLLLSPPFRCVPCLAMENETGEALENEAGKTKAEAPPRAEQDSINSGNADLIEWVNKTAPGPMVEVDPVTVFRRIVAERTKFLAMARAKQAEGGMDTIQSTAPSPFRLGSNWPDKSFIAIAVGLVFLACAAASYFLRSKIDREKQTEPASDPGKNSFDVPDDDRRKFVEDTIKAPESVLTAMAIGAASVGRLKGHTGPSYDVLHAANGNRVEAALPETGVGSKPIVYTTGIKDTQTEVHGNPLFEQVPFNPSNLGGFGSFKTQSAGVDVTEGPWFSHAADDSQDLQLDSNAQSTFVVQELEFENAVSRRQEVHFSSDVAVDQLVVEASVSEVHYESPSLNTVVDGEFLGEVVAVSAPTESAMQPSHSKVENLKFEEPEGDGVLTDSSRIVEKLEQMIGQELITSMEGKDVVGEMSELEQKQCLDASLLEPSNDQINATDLDSHSGVASSDSDDGVSNEKAEVKQSLTPLQGGNGVPLESSYSEGEYGSQATGGLYVEEHGDTHKLMSDVVKTLERIDEPQTAIKTVEEPQRAIKTIEKPLTAITTLEEPQLAVQTIKESQTAVQKYEETQLAIQAMEEPQTAIRILEEPQMAIQTTEESPTAVQKYKGPQLAIQAIREPETAIQILDEPRMAIQTAAESQTAVQKYEEPKLAIQGIEESETAMQALEEPQMAIQMFEEPQTAIQSFEEPETALQSFEEPETALQSFEEQQTALQVIEEPQTAIQSFEESQTVMQSSEEVQAAIQSLEEPQAVFQVITEPQTAVQQNIEGPQTASQSDEELQTTIQAVEGPEANFSLSINVNTNSGAIAYGSPVDTALRSSEEDPSVENKKALEAALPALAMGVGTAGAVFGVSGGLQVVGFAALASFLSQDFLWAESREELWQEVKSITDRQKLFNFLARRNIVKKVKEESSV